jgi:O-antigen ligase
LSLLIFPLVLANIPLLSQKQTKNIFLGFVISCFSASVICLGYALFQYIAHNDSHYFSYHPLVEIIGMHAIYMGMYVCFCIFIIVYFFGHLVFDKTDLRKKIVFFLSIIYFIVFLFLLSARAEIVAFFVISFTGIFIYAFKKRKMFQAFGLAGILLLFFAILIYFSPQNKERLKEAINYKSQYSIDKQWGGRAERLLMWDCSMDLVRNNLLTGVGIGDSQDELNKCYRTKNYGALLFYPNTQYNSHNQYLQTAIDLGIVGLIVLLICFFVVLRSAILAGNYLGVSFIVLFAVGCFTESMLCRQQGIVFYAFFNSLFAFHVLREKASTKMHERD